MDPLQALLGCRSMGPCADCGATLPIKGRRLCARDYSRHERAGTLDRFPLQKAAEVSQEAVIAAYRSDPMAPQAKHAESLGMSADAFKTALCKARKDGLLPYPRGFIRPRKPSD